MATGRNKTKRNEVEKETEEILIFVERSSVPCTSGPRGCIIYVPKRSGFIASFAGVFRTFTAATDRPSERVFSEIAVKQ